MDVAKKIGKLLACLAFALTMVCTLVPGLSLLDVADAAVTNAPQTSKTLVDNGDGTYTLALSVTGEAESETTTEVKKANVILVMDTSSSMVTNNASPGVTRLAAEQDALTKDDGIIDNLLAQNVPGDSVKQDIIEVAIVTFGNKGSIHQTWSHDADTLKDAVNNVTTDQGTNWEEGLYYAEQLADDIKRAQQDEDVYIIFMTDGEPTTHLNSYTVNWQGNGPDQEWAQAKDNARNIVSDGYHFYALFTWGANNRAHYLTSLVQAAYSDTPIDDCGPNDALSSDYA